MIESSLVVARHWRLVLLVAALQLGAAILVSAPWSFGLQNGSAARLPDADRALLEPGGLFLVEWLRLDANQLLAAVEASALLGVLVSFALLVPLAWLLSGLSSGDRFRYAEHAPLAFRWLPRFGLLFGLTGLTQAVLVGLVVVAWSSSAAELDPEGQPWLLMFCAGIALVAWTLPNLLQDLARAGVVERDLPVRGALLQALRTLLGRPLATLLDYLIPAALRALTVFLSLKVTLWLTALDGRYVLGTRFVIHQVCIVLMLVLRAVWLHRALLATRARPSPEPSSLRQAPGDTRADSAAPVDPSPGPAS
jgi:hypothetical protein